MEKKKEEKKKKRVQGRSFIISLRNDKNDIGEIIENIEEEYEKGIIRDYAYITHDKDVYSEGDEKRQKEELGKKYDDVRNVSEATKEEYIKQNSTIVKGCEKPVHTHFVIKFKTPRTVKAAGASIGIPVENHNYIRFCKNFKASYEYLTHKNQPEKYQYSKEEVNTSVKNESTVDMDRQSDIVDYYIYQIAEKGMSLKICEEQAGGVVFTRNMKMFKDARSVYLGKMKPPDARLNYYIEGKGGIGKDICSRAFARALYPELEEEECYYCVGENGVQFQKYDGQPVIIWSDARAGSLIGQFGRGQLLKVLDTHPTRAEVNIKYGSTVLVNTINIFNGTETYEEFLNGLAGEYTDKFGNEMKAEDKTQTYRRFPMIIKVEEESIKLLMNKGFMKGTREYLEYIKYCNISGSMRKAMQQLEEERATRVIENMTKPMIELHEKVTEKASKQEVEIDEDFSEYGRVEYYTDEENDGFEICESGNPFERVNRNDR